MKVNILLLSISVLALSACGPYEPEPLKKAKVNDSKLIAQANSIFGVLPESAPNEANPSSEEKILLGHHLYFDNLLSLQQTQSCNTCHDLATYGVDRLPTSKGDNGGFGDRNSPTVLNAALHMTQFWDGREPDVEAQAGGPILNPVEMAMPSEEELIARLESNPTYQDLFKAAYPEQENPFTYTNVRLAIADFERQLLTPARFDAYLQKDSTALTELEKTGLSTFINEGCITCHSGPLLGGNMYQKFGLFGNYWEYTNSEEHDEGRFTVTQSEGDRYMFKVPSMRNIAETYPYFHDGSVKDLKEAIRIMGKLQLNKELTEEQVLALEAFLKSLTGTVPESYQKAPQSTS
jgi:cytochrome c peroxidase